LLLKGNGTQDGVGNGSRVRVTERKPRLLVRLLRASLLNQGNVTLEGLAPVNADGRTPGVSRPARIGQYRKPDRREAEQQ
jgi:hypothetical protein